MVQLITFGIGPGGDRCMPPICTTSGVSGLEGSVMKCVLVKVIDGLTSSMSSNGWGAERRCLRSLFHNSHEP